MPPPPAPLQLKSKTLNYLKQYTNSNISIYKLGSMIFVSYGGGQTEVL